MWDSRAAWAGSAPDLSSRTTIGELNFSLWGEGLRTPQGSRPPRSPTPSPALPKSRRIWLPPRTPPPSLLKPCLHHRLPKRNPIAPMVSLSGALDGSEDRPAAPALDRHRQLAGGGVDRRPDVLHLGRVDEVGKHLENGRGPPDALGKRQARRGEIGNIAPQRPPAPRAA